MVYCSPLSNLDSYFCPNKSNGQWNEQKEPKRRWMKKADHWISEVECRMECRMEWNAGESQRTISTTISTGTEWATHMVSNNNQTKHQLINKSYIPPTGTENTDAVCHYKKKICCLTTDIFVAQKAFRFAIMCPYELNWHKCLVLSSHFDCV